MSTKTFIKFFDSQSSVERYQANYTFAIPKQMCPTFGGLAIIFEYEQAKAFDYFTEHSINPVILHHILKDLADLNDSDLHKDPDLAEYNSRILHKLANRLLDGDMKQSQINKLAKDLNTYMVPAKSKYVEDIYKAIPREFIWIADMYVKE